MKTVVQSKNNGNKNRAGARIFFANSGEGAYYRTPDTHTHTQQSIKISLHRFSVNRVPLVTYALVAVH